MKRSLVKYLIMVTAAMLYGCSLFAPVDPLPPSFSTIEVVDIKRTEIVVNATIQKPDSKNDRQEKKSGEIMEYGLVYGSTQDLNVELDNVIKLGTTGALPLQIENQRITGLTANTQYYVAIYARNEGGGMAYSEAVSVKTANQPGIFTTKVSVKVSMGGGSNYDLDEGKLVAKGDAQADISVDIFTIVGRGTVFGISSANGAVFKNLGVTDFNAITYLNLLNTTDYKADGVSVIMNVNTSNTVIVFKTRDGRYGKWRLESLIGNELTMSLIAYDN